MAIAPPHELLDLPDQGELVTRVTSWEQGTGEITPRTSGQAKLVPMIRIHVPREDKRFEPLYWDITATTLHPSLRGMLDQVVREGRWIRIQKFGVKPTARFTLELLPPTFAGPARAPVPA